MQALIRLLQSLTGWPAVGHAPQAGHVPPKPAPASTGYESLQARMLSTVAPPAPPMPAHFSAPQWVALLGQRIELGNTGFVIQLNTKPGQMLYEMYTPEGWRISWGVDLPEMKALAERLARERREFEVEGPRA